MGTLSSTLDALMSRGDVSRTPVPETRVDNWRTFTPGPLPISLNISRFDLPEFMRELGFTRGAEIGVWKGGFSAAFCKANPSLHMLCVDPWEPYGAWRDSKNSGEAAQALMTEAYCEAMNRLYGLNCTIVRRFSAQAAPAVADRSLDFVFIDGNHGYDFVLQDLQLWSPKVRSGGLVVGHDYVISDRKPFIEVVPAVLAYTAEHDIDPWFVLTADQTPSFLWVVQ